MKQLFGLKINKKKNQLKIEYKKVKVNKKGYRP